MLRRTLSGIRVVLCTLLLISLPCLALSQTTSAADTATLTIRVPADAKVTVAGDLTTLTGTERAFVTPSLKRGRRFSYKIVGTWTEKGKTKKVERLVRFRPGDSIIVDLTVPEKPKDKPKDKPKSDDLKEAERLKMPRREPVKKSEAPKTRKFRFTYAGALTGLKVGEEARVWVPVPRTSGDQHVKSIARDLPKGATNVQETDDATYGNRILSFSAKANDKGNIPFRFVYEVKRKEVKGRSAKTKGEDARRIARFLQADALVPITGRPLALLDGKPMPGDPMGKARVMYDVVDAHMKYSKEGQGWGRGDSAWACDSKFGNCSDFHSLFISMARSKKIPAKFEIGFPLPEKHGAGTITGYHCWAFFRPGGKAWVPVDISEANKHPNKKDYYFGNLSEDRIAFSTGRDITLVPRQAGKPLNFFIYPYAEVQGKEVPQTKIIKTVEFKDMK